MRAPDIAAVSHGETRFPFVTVVVPTYNRAKTLPFLFESLAKQHYPADRMELIVVDNSSNDNTEEVVEQWKQVFPFRARFSRKDNKGPAASRNYGAARAEGPCCPCGRSARGTGRLASTAPPPLRC